MKKEMGFVLGMAWLSMTVQGQELKRLNLDDVSSVSPKIEVDQQVKVEGTGCVKVTAQWPVTICLGEVEGLDVENAKLVYSARVKTEMDGTAYLEMWAHVDGGQYFSRGMNDVVGQNSEWKVIQTPFIFQKGQQPDKVTLNLVIEGKGRVWIDDIVLRKEALR